MAFGTATATGPINATRAPSCTRRRAGPLDDAERLALELAGLPRERRAPAIAMTLRMVAWMVAFNARQAALLEVEQPAKRRRPKR